MLFFYRNWGMSLFGLIVYAAVVAICIWVMSTMIKKYFKVKEEKGAKEAFKQASYHFVPVLVLLIISSVIYIYGSIIEIGGYYKVENGSIKMRYITRQCGTNMDVKESDVNEIVLLVKKPRKEVYVYNKIKESLENHKTYDEIKANLKNTKQDKKVKEELAKKSSYSTLGIGAYDTAYIKIKNKYYIMVITRLVNSKGQNLYEYLEKKYNTPVKVIGT